MNKLLYMVLLLLNFFVNSISKGESNLLDSLNQLAETTTDDSLRLRVLVTLSEECDADEIHRYAKRAIALADVLLEKEFLSSDKIKLLNLKANALNNLGFYYDSKGEITAALEAYSECLKIEEKTNNFKGKAQTLNNIATIFEQQGQVQKALDLFSQSLKLYEENGDSFGTAGCLNNMGNIYQMQEQYSEALTYYERSLQMVRKSNNKAGIAHALNNIGTVYINQKMFTKAMEAYQESLSLWKEVGSKVGISQAINNISHVHKRQGDLKQALTSFEISLKIREELGDKHLMCVTLYNIGWIYLELKSFDRAKLYANRSLNLAKELGFPNDISNAAMLYAEIYRATDETKLGWQMFELHIEMRDSIKNKENEKAAIRLQTKYDFEKTLLVKKQAEKEKLRIAEAIIERRNNLQYSGIFIGLIAIFAIVFLLGKFKVPGTIMEFSIFMSFLLLFEFTLVYLDPYVDRLTGGLPIFKLGVNAILAGIIFPIHGFFERLMRKRVVGEEGISRL